MVSLGTALLIILLILNLLIQSPSPGLQTIYKIFAALGVSGFLSGIGGGVFQVNLSNKLTLGGALGFSVLVFYLYPIGKFNDTIKLIFKDECISEEKYSPTDTTFECKFKVKEKTILILEKYDKVKVDRIDGEISLGKIIGKSKPKGIEEKFFGLTNFKFNIVDDINHGALIYMVGNTTWESLEEKTGKELGPITYQSHIIQFDVNDVEKSNNNGSYIVVLTITEK